jgi:hypothetical protein
LAQLEDLPTKSIKGEKSPSADEDTVDTSDCAAVAASDQALLALRTLESLRYREFRIIGTARCLPRWRHGWIRLPVVGSSKN